MYEKGAGWADDASAGDNGFLQGGSVGWDDVRSVAISEDGSVIVAGGCNYINSESACRGRLPTGGGLRMSTQVPRRICRLTLMGCRWLIR